MGRATRATLKILAALVVVAVAMPWVLQVPSYVEYRRLRAEFEALEVPASKPTEEQVERGESLLMIASRVRDAAARVGDDEFPPGFAQELPRIMHMRELLLSATPPALPPPPTGSWRAGYALDYVPGMLRNAAIFHSRAGDDASALRDIEAAWKLSGCIGLDGRPNGDPRGAIVACDLVPRLEGSETVTWLDESPVATIIERQRAEIRELLEHARAGDFDGQRGCVVREPPPFLARYRARLRSAWCAEVRVALDDLRAMEDVSRCRDAWSDRNSTPPGWWVDPTVLMAHVGNAHLLELQRLRITIDMTRAALAWRARRGPDGHWPPDFDPAPFNTCESVAFTLDASADVPTLRAVATDGGTLWDEWFPPGTFEFTPPQPGAS